MGRQAAGRLPARRRVGIPPQVPAGDGRPARNITGREPAGGRPPGTV